MSTDLRKRSAAVSSSTTNGLARPGIPSPGTNHRPTYHSNQSPAGGGGGATAAAASVGTYPLTPTQMPRRPPPPPYGGGMSQQQQHSPYSGNSGGVVGGSTYPQGYSTSPQQMPQQASRPAYNYAAATTASPATTASASSNTKSYGGYSGGYIAPSYNNGGNTDAGNYAFATNSSRRVDQDDNKYKKKKKRSVTGGGFGSDNTILAFFFALVAVGLYAMVMTILFFAYRNKTNSMLKSLDQPSTKAVIDHVTSLQNEIQNKQRQLHRTERQQSQSSTQQINNLERQNRLLQKDIERLQEQYESSDSIAQHERLLERDYALKEQVQWLQATTRRESKRTVLERFGPGPHKVEITYALGYLSSSSHNNTSDATENTAIEEDTRPKYSFVVDLAPVELVPHAIHLFLEQVDHGLLNGTYFYLNGPHIVQAGPQLDDSDFTDNDYIEASYTRDSRDAANEDATIGASLTDIYGDTISIAATKTASRKRSGSADETTASEDDEEQGKQQKVEAQEDKRSKAFADLGLDKLSFPDYSEEYPHVPWTLGFTGRPGGPDWYINKVDNTEGHGPGGQYQHALEEQGDSCFGRVAPGQGRDDLARYVFGSQIYSDRSDWHFFIYEPIEIISAVVLTKQPSVHKIHMGLPLHRKDYIKVKQADDKDTTIDNSSSSENFNDVLNNALHQQGMDPVESDPKVAATHEGQNREQIVGNQQQQQQQQQSQQQDPATTSREAQQKAKRKPRIPHIDGATEA